MTEQSRHIDVLDGLRAMAIMLVLAGHGLDFIWPGAQKPYFTVGPVHFSIFFHWVSGVDLFFVLSGFLITGQLLDGGIADREGRWQRIGQYLKRRACRIVPAYYLILTCTTVIMAIIDPYRTGAAAWMHSYIYHLFFLQDFFYPQYYPIFWSLAVEFQFYLVAPFLILALLLLKRPGLRWLAIAAAIIFLAELRTLAVVHGPPAKTYDDWFFNIRILLPYSLDGILGGMLCGFLWNDEKARAFMQRKYICNGLFFGGVLLIIALDGLPHPLEPVSLFDQTFLLLFIAAAFSCMMLGLLSGSAGRRVFSSRPLRHIATVSYSMYLIHITYMKDVFDVAWRLTHALNNPYATYFTGMALMTAVTVLLSTLMYRYVEKPFIDWAKRPKAQATAPA